MHCNELIKGKSWVCVADAPLHPVTGKRRQISRRGRSKGIAANKVIEAIRKLTDFGVNEKDAEKMTFEELGNLWIEEYGMSGVKKTSVSSRKTSMNKLNRYLGKTRLSEISPQRYQAVLTDLFKRNHAKASLDNYHATAGMIFKHGIKLRIIKENPHIETSIPRRTLTVEEIELVNVAEVFFERDELEVFLETAVTRGLYLDAEFFYTSAFSGMRSGEILALKETDLNFERNQISVTKTISSETGKMEEYDITPPKSYSSIRVVDMDQGVMTMLSNLIERRKSFKDIYGEKEDRHDENFVFCRPNGYPYLNSHPYRRMMRLMKLTTIEKHITPHMIRHTHVSMLTEAGADLNYIMSRVGHKNSKMTQEVYTHVSKRTKKTVSEDMHMKFGDLVAIAIPV